MAWNFGNFTVHMAEAPCAEYKKKVWDPDQGWVKVWKDYDDVWQVSQETRLPNRHLLEKTWNFPANERGWRRAMATAWRLSQGEDLPPHEETEWI